MRQVPTPDEAFDSLMTTTRLWVWCGIGLLVSEATTIAIRADDFARVLRVESEIFANDEKVPLARTLTLFRNGIAWDFLDLPVDAGATTTHIGDDADRVERSADGAENTREAFKANCGEIVLHDPARERAVLIDPSHNLKTQIDTLRLERLSVSLTNWARTSDDRLVRWAGGPDFGDGFKDRTAGLELIGPRVRYDVHFIPAPFPEATEMYRRFADTAILLKALVHPGGVPPFPRLAINQRVAAAGGIPSVVTLQLDVKMSILPGRCDTLRSVHKVHPRLLAGDLERIQQAEMRVAVAESVDLAVYVKRSVRAASRDESAAKPAFQPASSRSAIAQNESLVDETALTRTDAPDS